MTKGEPSSEQAYEFAVSFLGLNEKQRSAFLVHMTGNQCRILRLCAYNILLNGDITIPAADRRYLQRNQGVLRQLASKRLCLGDKRILLANKGLLIRRLLRIVVDYIGKERQRRAPSTPTTVNQDTNQEKN